MSEQSNPVFHDIKRDTFPTDVEFFETDQDILTKLEADRAARLEVIHDLVAHRDVLLARCQTLTGLHEALVAERALLVREHDTALFLAEAAERKLNSIKGFVLWRWLPAPVKASLTGFLLKIQRRHSGSL